MKLHSYIFLILNLILLTYWLIKKSTQISYANQYSKWEVGSNLKQYYFLLSHELYKHHLHSPDYAKSQQVNFNYLKLLIDINEEIDLISFKRIDSIKNEYNNHFKVIRPENTSPFPNFKLKYYPSEFELILNKLIVRSIGEIAFSTSYYGKGCGIDRLNICTPYLNSINKYRLFYLYLSTNEYFDATYLVLNKDTIINPITLPVPVKFSSPVDSTTKIYKFIHLYGQKDSLISTYKTKIIELD